MRECISPLQPANGEANAVLTQQAKRWAENLNEFSPMAAKTTFAG